MIDSENIDGAAPVCRCSARATQLAFQRIEASLSRRYMLGGIAAWLGLFAGFGLNSGRASAQTPDKPLLLENLRLFNGRDLRLRDDVDVLIEGNAIKALLTRGQGPREAEHIDCGGLSLIPGLIDAHWHMTIAAVPEVVALTADVNYVLLVAAREAEATLQRGFTTVRDVGGPSFALKRAIDEGVVNGPRVFPSGAMISQTSGHGDFRLLNELPRTALSTLSYAERAGMSAIADGEDQVLLRVREQLMRGASQIKILAGGGVASHYDPLDTAQFTEREMRAAVDAAQDWGTYVCAHVYTSEGIRRSVRAGVKSIEHGQLADEDTVKFMADHHVWWSLQPFLGDEDANPYTDPQRRAALLKVAEGTVNAYRWAKKHGVPIAFGTDILMAPGKTATQGKQLAKLAQFMSPLEALRVATGNNGKLLALAGERAPYGGAPLGYITPGAPADVLLVEGNPERDLSFLVDPARTLRLIVKDGRIHKRTI